MTVQDPLAKASTPLIWVAIQDFGICSTGETDSTQPYARIKWLVQKLVCNSLDLGLHSYTYPAIFPVHARYTRNIFEPHFQVSGEVIKSDGTKFYVEERHFEISEFHGSLSERVKCVSQRYPCLQA